MWPKVVYEERPWDRGEDILSMIPKSRRQKITATYMAAVPPYISNAAWEMPVDLAARSSELRAQIARFDQDQKARKYNLPALMLRSESASSSQIEHLTSSVRNVALAELSDKTPANAQLIAGNVAAMRKVIESHDFLDMATIVGIHAALLRDEQDDAGIRQEQVWIGGTNYSPHGALFVPPHHSRVPALLDDLLIFAKRTNMDPLAKVAIFHAQFETIHPFTDGNGRTGRALLHRMLASEEVLMHASIPVSAGLLHHVDDYMSALDAYHEGYVEPIVEQLLNALELAIVLGSRMAKDIDEVLDRWNTLITDRAGSAALRLPALLVEQPVVDVAYVAKHLDITERAARNLIETAVNRGILTKMGNAKRGAFYQAAELLEILEDASSKESIRRMLIC